MFRSLRESVAPCALWDGAISFALRALLGVWLLLLASCGPYAQQASPPSQLPEDGVDAEGSLPKQCSAFREMEVTDGKRKRVPITQPELIALGSEARDEAINFYNNTVVEVAKNDRSGRAGASVPHLPWPPTLSAAMGCYTRALKLAPDDYEAELGLGVVYVLAAHAERESAEASRSYAAKAKHHLGRAFVASQGSFEPLYYLADVALLEGDHQRAFNLLSVLQNAEVKPDAVAMSFGFLAERQGKSDRAREWYVRALRLGASPETLPFLVQKVRPQK